MATVGEEKEVSKESIIDRVVVHPLVLLSVVDHFNRIGKTGNIQRVVGVLLGSRRNKILDISNSFAGRYRCKQHSRNREDEFVIA